MKVTRFLAVLLALLAIAAIPSAAAPLTGPCSSVSGYDPACDVNHDGNIDIIDIQLTAGHWGQTGTYNIYPAMVPKTGQTTSYAAGDDGALERGVTWPVPRFADNLNGTVTDNLTGLIWLRNANCYGTRVWAQALVDANGLSYGSCGLNDGSTPGQWRLPSVRELQSLVDYGRWSPAFPTGHPFIGVQSEDYWSSTTVASSTSQAFYVHLGDGFVLFDNKINSAYFVWPVRGGQ